VRTTLALILSSIAVVLPAASSAQPSAKIACSRDVPAVIGGVHKCLGAGEYCATRYERQYEERTSSSGAAFSARTVAVSFVLETR
jgi:hypothetical protein